MLFTFYFVKRQEELCYLLQLYYSPTIKQNSLFNSFFELFYALIQQIFVHSLPLSKYLLVTEDKIMNKSKQCPGFMKFTANIVDKH